MATNSPTQLFRTLAISCILLVAPNAMAQEWVYSVVEGDTLSEFSQKHLYKTSYWKQLQKINNIADPKRIPENTKLRVPLAWIKSQPASTVATAIEGDAKIIKHADNSQEILTLKSKFNLGDQLHTGNQASVIVRFADGSEMLVLQNSRVSFNHLRQYGETGMVDSRVQLISGEIDTVAQPQRGDGARLEIHTPAAISAVRGTEFRTAYSADNNTARIEVLEGGVAVKGAKRTRLVRSGFGTTVEKNKAPMVPKKLQPAPTLLELPEEIQQIGYEVRWNENSKAANYRAQISKSDQMTTILWDSHSPRNRINLPDLADNTYYLQVRAIDHDGIEGFATNQAIILNARPQPPFPMAPANKATLRGQTPLLEWTRSSDAENYIVEIATDANFQNIVTSDSGLTTPNLNLTGLAESQTYFWRLASVDSKGEQGPYSDTRVFDVKPIPATPQPELEQDEQEVKLSWASSKYEQTYQVQIARDRKFATILTDTTVAEPEIAIPRPEGYRYIRVRALADDGYAGAWGVTQELTPPPSDSWVYVFGSFVLTILLL
ncbi:FecR domain-containing protein [Neptuniibacter sp. QD48_11]|uniref:FecR domain-containing protein n=1 Tax=Neptuniibacter sp. QD48_11 TaxID=3398211 RepID=UPI0039F49697